MKLSAIISWCVILLIAIGIPIANHFGRERQNDAKEHRVDEPVDVQTVMMGKYFVGWGLFGLKEQQPGLIEQFDTMAKTPVQKVAAAIVAGEFTGKEEAIKRLTLHEVPANDAFVALYENGTPLPPEVAKQYGFFARLAQTNGKPSTDPNRADVVETAKTAAVLMLGAFGAGGLAVLVGVGLLITAIVLAATGKLRFAVGQPVGSATVYVEAFALYLTSFVAGGLLIALLLPESGIAINMLPLVLGVGLATVWPRFRGVRPADQRTDWGLYLTRGFALDVLAGVGGYLAGLPLLACAVVVSVTLGRLTNTQLSHPIQNVIADKPLLMAFFAVVFAPITEEMLFRGAFVSHLRRGMNAFIAALISGLIFAAIHPQGWVGIPVIGTIGFVLAIIRQWRGSLISSITAHALNNGMIVGLLILLA